MTTIARQTRERIERAVKRVEAQSFGFAGLGHMAGQPSGGHQVLLVAQADIEHGATGNCKLATGTAGSWTADAASALYAVQNLRQKIWSGSLVLATWCSWKGTGAVEPIWLAVQAWSATRIRGKASAEINPGQTGTLNTLIPYDGHFGAATLSAFLPTVHVKVKADKVAWAELVFLSGAPGSSRWEIYSADCDGEG